VAIIVVVGMFGNAALMKDDVVLVVEMAICNAGTALVKAIAAVEVVDTELTVVFAAEGEVIDQTVQPLMVETLDFAIESSKQVCVPRQHILLGQQATFVGLDRRLPRFP